MSALLLLSLLRRHGRQVLYLGTDVPTERLHVVLEDVRLTALVLAAQLLSSAAALRETMQALLGSGILVGYGGRSGCHRTRCGGTRPRDC